MTATATGQILRCPSCGQANRVPDLAEGKRAVCGQCKSPLGGGGPVELNDTNFRSAIAEGAFVVDFWAAWCGPCRQVAPVMDQIAAEYEGTLKVAKIDVDAESELAGAFGVSSIPTIALFEPGEQPKAVVGALPKEVLETAFELERFSNK